MKASKPPDRLEPEPKPPADGPYFLMCPFCRWSSLEVGIEFEKMHGISKQLAEMKNGGLPSAPSREKDKERDRRLQMLNKKRFAEDLRLENRLTEEQADSLPADDSLPEQPMSHEETFTNLVGFYKFQLNKASPSNPFSSRSSYLTRLMAMSSAAKRDEPRQRPMPEARNVEEGLRILPDSPDAGVVERMRALGWEGSVSSEQAATQLLPGARFASDLRPMPTLLRTKRTKRCRTCRHILSRPENKVTSTRYKIKLLALHQIPRLTLRPLPPGPSTPGPTPASTSSPPPSGTQIGAPSDHAVLSPLVPTQFLLTLTNPLFDPVRITLATPAATPPSRSGLSSRVTILCPQFEIGANTDVWDEALGSSSSAKSRADSVAHAAATSAGGTGGTRQAEAGKIWERGRNWTSVIVEVVPAATSVQPPPPKTPASTSPAPPNGAAALGEYSDDDGADDGELDEDEDVLEIPVFVRCEYEAEVAAEDRAAAEAREGGAGGAAGGAGKGREKREEAFWCVLGVGRIAV